MSQNPEQPHQQENPHQSEQWQQQSQPHAAEGQPTPQPQGYDQGQPGIQAGAHTGASSDAQPGAQPGAYPGVQPGTYSGAQPGPYPGAQAGPYPGVTPYPIPQQYAQWYNPHDAPAKARDFALVHLVTKPVYLLLLISAALYTIMRIVPLADGWIAASSVSGANAVGFLLGAVLTMVFFMGLYVLVLIPITYGKNWGRIVGFVLAGLGILAALIGLIGVTMYGPVLAMLLVILALLFIGVNIAWIVAAARTWEKPVPAPYMYPPVQ
ncbi:hypothetical protein [Kocuria sp.]|uniref:hypothetical protein n=1 Tax=Kocuria sp. TaxID=1871328 RepID=UPI0026DED96F|nr:hypothetical protein [Kocuria sp.]MDO5618177.1 hypothetical protein [Kocuria sp.]